MQEFDLDPTQMKEVVVVLEKLGFLTSVEVQRSRGWSSLLEELIVPGFEALDTNASFSLSLMNLTPNKRPVSSNFFLKTVPPCLRLFRNGECHRGSSADLGEAE